MTSAKSVSRRRHQVKVRFARRSSARRRPAAAARCAPEETEVGHLPLARSSPGTGKLLPDAKLRAGAEPRREAVEQRTHSACGADRDRPRTLSPRDPVFIAVLGRTRTRAIPTGRSASCAAAPARRRGRSRPGGSRTRAVGRAADDAAVDQPRIGVRPANHVLVVAVIQRDLRAESTDRSRCSTLTSACDGSLGRQAGAAERADDLLEIRKLLIHARAARGSTIRAGSVTSDCIHGDRGRLIRSGSSDRRARPGLSRRRGSRRRRARAHSRRRGARRRDSR